MRQPKRPKLCSGTPRAVKVEGLVRSAPRINAFGGSGDLVRGSSFRRGTTRLHSFTFTGYVVMPEHVHLLLSEPERSKLSVAIQMLKQITSKKLRAKHLPRFWQVRYYDFPVWSEAKRIEKLRYIHRNPVKRGLVERPADWKWSSFVHYATGMEGIVEIESPWTARRREQMGVVLVARAHPPAKNAGRVGQPRG